MVRKKLPGLWDDGETSRGVRDKLRNPCLTLDDYGVLAESAFPVSGDMKGQIFTPLKRGDLEKAINAGGNVVCISTVKNAVISIRQADEWGMGAVEKWFRRLSLPLSYNPKVRRQRLVNIHRLYNYRVHRTNISQIRSVFIPPVV